jgi:hypothetical protein
VKLEDFDNLNDRIRKPLNARLEKLGPAAAASIWLVQQKNLTMPELKIATLLMSWTCGKGKRWQAMDRTTYRQLGEGLGLVWGPATGNLIGKALAGLLAKGVAHRIPLDWKRSYGWHLAFIELALQRPHDFAEHDPDRDEADALLDELWEAENVGKAVLAAGKQHRNGDDALRQFTRSLATPAKFRPSVLGASVNG